MHILLPPSETKRSGGGGIFSVEQLAHSAELGEARTMVAEALVAVSRDDDTAAKALKLGAKNIGEREHNLVLQSSGVMPAMDRYTGVLYDALRAREAPASVRSWLSTHASVQSALFGMISSGDKIPAYRVSASSRLPALGATLRRVWVQAHERLDWERFGWILDLRSKDYAALAPLSSVARGAWLQVAQRSKDGRVRALNHFNKAAKGDLVRRLAIGAPEIRSESEFIDWAAAEGFEVAAGQTAGELMLITSLGAPATATTR